MLPRNGVKLFFDFKKAPLIDWRNIVSAPTPNESKIEVRGYSATWVAAVFQGVLDRLHTENNWRQYIHAPFSYDVGLFILGLPLAFYVLSSTTRLLGDSPDALDPFVKYAFYLYIFLFTLVFFRLLLGYTRWVFPILELRGEHDISKVHRRFWYTVMTGIIAAVIANLIFN
jgi:hypothetical protein